ncbi:VIR protein [Plasmodium vivax]|uniref:VIR protein n=1 Tax=Plasmodium vivax TaxID=5855 RepID=A0A1G4GR81_PLAVI|nr:VIR protein [Plasmodium vivax]
MKIIDRLNANIPNDPIPTYPHDIYSEKCDHQSFCRNFVLAQRYLSDLIKKESTINVAHACKFLIYWIYKFVWNDDIYNKNISNFYEQIKKGHDNKDICKIYMEDIDEKTYGYIQKLIKLYSDLSNLPTLNNGKKCSTIKTCFDTYMDYKDTCKDDEYKNFCNELENFRIRYNVAIKSVNNCGEEQKYLPSFQDSPIVPVSVIPIIITSVISLILIISCKFTPLGKWICPRSKRAKNGTKKINHEMKKPQHTSGYQDMPYLVSYQSPNPS